MIGSVALDHKSLSALRRLDLLDAPAEEAFDRLTRLAADLFGVRAAFVVLLDDDRDFYLSQSGFPEPLVSTRQLRGETFSRQVAEADGSWSREDVRGGCQLRNDPLMAALDAVSCAGAPLRLPDGVVVGAFCVVDVRPRRWSDQELRVLTEMATSIVAEMELRLARRTAEVARTRYRDLIHDVDAVVWEMDLDTSRFTFVSQNAEKVFGHPVESWLDEPAFWEKHIVHADDRERVLALSTEATLEGREFDCRGTAADGRTLWLHNRLRVVLDAGGRPVLLRGVAVDVTAQRKTAEALGQAEERFRQVAENINAVFWLYDFAESRTIYVSPAYETLWGRPTEALTTASGHWLQAVHPDDCEHVAVAAASRHGDYELEYRIVRPDGEVRWVRDRGFPVHGPSGEIYRMAGIAEDITKQKAAAEALSDSEERFRLMVEGSEQVFFYEHDPDGRLTYLSPSVRNVLGHEADELLGKRLAALLAGDESDAEVQGRTEAALASAGRSGSYTAHLRSSTGETIVVELIERPLVRDGVVTGIQGFARDITKRKDAERKLRESEEQFRQAQKMEAVGRLAGGVAHDFNNILTAIRGHVDLVLGDLGEADPLREDMEEVARSADRAAGLTRQLLAFSRQQVLRPQALDLNAVIGEMEGMLRRLIGETVRLETRLHPELSTVQADASQLQQVVMNLVVNGRDAMPRGGELTLATMDASLSPADVESFAYPVRPGPYVLLEVSDTGEGMDEDTRNRIFDPFFTTKPAGKGTGLGLSTVYGIVKQSGGYVWADSEPGVGTRFRIYLPRAGVRLEPAQGPGSVASGRPTNGAASGTILVAEDERSVRHLICKTLRRRGFDVLEAENGQAALDLLAARPEGVDLVLTDVVMPDMGGSELGRAIRESQPTARILYMSGYTEDELVLEPGGILRSEVAFLEKPFAAADLFHAVERAIGG